MGCRFLLQGLSQTWGSNLGFHAWQADLYRLSHREALRGVTAKREIQEGAWSISGVRTVRSPAPHPDLEQDPGMSGLAGTSKIWSSLGKQTGAEKEGIFIL